MSVVLRGAARLKELDKIDKCMGSDNGPKVIEFPIEEACCVTEHQRRNNTMQPLFPMD